MTPPAPSNTDQIEPAQEQSVPVILVEVQTQPSIDDWLGSSYIMESQVTQIENVSCNNSISSSNSITQEYLQNHFNKWLNDKAYNTFKELFQGINIDSMREALPKVSIYNSIIAKFIDEINSKYGMALTFTTLELWNYSNLTSSSSISKVNKMQMPSPGSGHWVCIGITTMKMNHPQLTTLLRT